MSEQVFVRVGRKVFGPMTAQKYAERRPMLPVDAEVAREKAGPWTAVYREEPKPAAGDVKDAPIFSPAIDVNGPEYERAEIAASNRAAQTSADAVILSIIVAVIVTLLIAAALASGTSQAGASSVRNVLVLSFAILRALAFFVFAISSAVILCKASRCESEDPATTKRFLKAIACGVIAIAVSMTFVVELQWWGWYNSQ